MSVEKLLETQVDLEKQIEKATQEQVSKALARQKVKALQEKVESVEMEKAKAESELWDITTKIHKVDEDLEEDQDLAEALDSGGLAPASPAPRKEQDAMNLETKKMGRLSKR